MFKETFEEKKFEKKEELIEAALKEFSEKSFDDASLNNILANISMSKGSFYYHFKNKEELYVYLYLVIAKAKIDFIEGELKPLSGELEDKDVFTLLKIYGRAGLKFAITHPLYYKFGKRFIREENLKIKDAVKKALGGMTTPFFQDLVERAIIRGEIRDDFPLEFTSKLFLNLFMHYEDVVFKDIDKISFDEIMENYDNFIEFIKNGLSSERGGGRDE